MFNPPWLPVENDGEESISDHLIGLASYRDPDLMGRFLDGCFEQLVSETVESARARARAREQARARLCARKEGWCCRPAEESEREREKERARAREERERAREEVGCEMRVAKVGDQA